MNNQTKTTQDLNDARTANKVLVILAFLIGVCMIGSIAINTIIEYWPW